MKILVQRLKELILREIDYRESCEDRQPARLGDIANALRTAGEMERELNQMDMFEEKQEKTVRFVGVADEEQSPVKVVQ